MKQRRIVILGTAHRQNAGGNCSPDRTFYEYQFSREVCFRVKQELEAAGFTVFIDLPDNIILGTPTEELRKRCRIVNGLCDHFGKHNCLYLSIHVNAAGSGQQWRTAGGWSVYTSPGTTQADRLATSLYEAARLALADYARQFEENKRKGLYDHKQRPFRTDFLDGDPDQEARFYVLVHTKCPAALTENLFQDNKADVAYLISPQGLESIVRLHTQGVLDYFGFNGRSAT